MKIQIKEHVEKHIRFYKAALMALVPLVMCIVTCAIEGYAIWDAYIPASDWNDELFYFKQVEGMVKYGYPYGYFGFNESHAEVLSFAAWSPVLVWPWLLWGFLFGWNLMSPIYCNIVVMMTAVFLFVWLVKPDVKQMLRMVVLFAAFPLFVRYMLSGMPECTCFGMLIVFFGFAYAYMQEEKNSHIVGMFVISGLLTLMRPYMIVFLVLPAVLLIWKRKWYGVGISAGIAGITAVLYVLIKKFLAAEYFTPLFDTTWIGKYLKEGIAEGWRFMWNKLYVQGWDFIGKCMQGVKEGLATGNFFVGFLLVMVIVGLYALYRLVQGVRKSRASKQASLTGSEDYKTALIYGHYAFCCFAMWMALLLMYKMQEGSKHLLTFIAAGLFAMAMMKVKYSLQVVLCSAVFIYLYFFMAVDAYDYQNRFQNEELVAEIEGTKEDFYEKLTLNTEDVPNYDNDVIWVTYDYDAQTGEQMTTDYQILYGLPAGFGISCCYPDFILDNFDTLQSKYICVPVGGNIDMLCQEYELEAITQGMNAICYQLR